MIVVSDSSPIISLARVGQLQLMERLFGQIVVPAAVLNEIAAGPGRPGAVEVARTAWLKSALPNDQRLAGVLGQTLGAGEAQAIAVALELRADLLLIDERRARRTAESLGLRVAGLLAVLVEAKRAGLLPLIQPTLDELVNRGGMWVSRALYDQALRLAGE